MSSWEPGGARLSACTLRLLEAGVVGNDCGLQVRLLEICGEECRLAFTGVEDHFLGGAPFGGGGDHTL